MSSERYPQTKFDFGRTWGGVLLKYWFYEVLTALSFAGCATAGLSSLMGFLGAAGLARFIMVPLFILLGGIWLVHLEARKRRIEPDLVLYFEHVLSDQGFLHRFLFDMNVTEMRALVPHIKLFSWRIDLDSPPKTMNMKLIRLAENWHDCLAEAGIVQHPGLWSDLGQPPHPLLLISMWFSLLMLPASFAAVLALADMPWAMFAAVLLGIQAWCATLLFHRAMVAKAVLGAIINIRYVNKEDELETEEY